MLLMDIELENARSLRLLFEKRDSRSLRGLGGNLAREALVRSNRLLTDLSILSFSLSKLCEKNYIVNSRHWPAASSKVVEHLRAAESLFEEGKEDAARERVHDALGAVDALSVKTGRFVASVVEKARIKAAAQMYAHGASLGSVASFTGASKADLADYVGHSRIPDKYSAMPVEQRLKAARDALS